MIVTDVICDLIFSGFFGVLRWNLKQFLKGQSFKTFRKVEKREEFRVLGVTGSSNCEDIVFRTRCRGFEIQIILVRSL